MGFTRLSTRRGERLAELVERGSRGAELVQEELATEADRLGMTEVAEEIRGGQPHSLPEYVKRLDDCKRRSGTKAYWRGIRKGKREQ